MQSRSAIRALLATFLAVAPFAFTSPARAQAAEKGYLGFDSNEYPGDELLPQLRRTFTFSGFWLNSPPGAGANEPSGWSGKRAVLLENNFGFLVLFNGRLDRELARSQNPAALGAQDAQLAVEAARREQFPVGTVIFLDQEEGGRLLPEQMTYVLHWIDRIRASGYKAGVYCSGIAVKDGKNKTITTAEHIRSYAENQDISFFVYNDACPPSPGCVYGRTAPAASASGTRFAAVWQFAQSPRRREFTARCASSYDQSGNCYPPAVENLNPAKILLDLDTANSPDPSNGR
jgi:glycoside hydrolase-like protein